MDSAVNGGRKPMPPSAPSSAPPRQTALRCSTPSGSCCQPNDPGRRSPGQGEQLQVHGQTGFSYNLSSPTDGGAHKKGFDPKNGDVPPNQMVLEPDFFHAGYIR